MGVLLGRAARLADPSRDFHDPALCPPDRMSLSIPRRGCRRGRETKTTTQTMKKLKLAKSLRNRALTLGVLALPAILAPVAMAQATAESLVTAITGEIDTVDGHMWTIGAAVAAVVGVVVVVTLLLRNGKKVATSS